MKKRIFQIFIVCTLMIFIIACGGGSDVKVNTQGAENKIQASPTIQLGTSRDNPAPVGAQVLSDNMSFIITGSTRPADYIVSSGNMFNTEPEDGQEYLFINLQITCMKSSNEECSLSLFNFKAVGALGIVYDTEWLITGVDGLLEDTGFYGGTTISGNLPFIIRSDDTNILIKYEPFLGDIFFMNTP